MPIIDIEYSGEEYAGVSVLLPSGRKHVFHSSSGTTFDYVCAVMVAAMHSNFGVGMTRTVYVDNYIRFGVIDAEGPYSNHTTDAALAEVTRRFPDGKAEACGAVPGLTPDSARLS